MKIIEQMKKEIQKIMEKIGVTKEEIEERPKEKILEEIVE